MNGTRTDEGNPTPTTLTVELVDRIIAALLSDPDSVGEAAVQWLRDRKDALVGLTAEAVATVLRSIGDGGEADQIHATRTFVNYLPTLAAVNEFYTSSVEDLEASAEPPMRLGGILRSLAQYGAGVAPRVLSALLTVVGI